MASNKDSLVNVSFILPVNGSERSAEKVFRYNLSIETNHMVRAVTQVLDYSGGNEPRRECAVVED